MKHLIIALDNMKKKQARDFVIEVSDSLNSPQIIYKINDLLALVWFEWLHQLFSDTGAFFMIDGKYHDIGNTLINYLKQLKSSRFSEKVKFLTVHASNWKTALAKLMQTKKDLGLDNIKILAITALTSLGSEDTISIYQTNSFETVLKLTGIAKSAWVDWVVCSAEESAIIKEIFGKDFITMTPWIRLSHLEWDDQSRIKTPSEAIKSWSDNLVIWRPILQSENKIKVITEILDEMKRSDYLDGSISNESLFQKLLLWNDWEKILQHIWVMYLRPKGGKYCRLASGLYSNAYINIGILERYPIILQKISNGLREKLVRRRIFDEDNKKDYIIMGAQMWSVRISSHLSLALWISGTSIYTEKDWDEMRLKRHNINLVWKKVIISEDIISAGSTIKKMRKIVESLGWKLVAVTCFWNRNGWEDFEWIPLIYCYKPLQFELYYDDDTPEENRKNYPKLPEDSRVILKAKNHWNELIESMK